MNCGKDASDTKPDTRVLPTLAFVRFAEIKSPRLGKRMCPSFDAAGLDLWIAARAASAREPAGFGLAADSLLELGPGEEALDAVARNSAGETLKATGTDRQSPKSLLIA